MIYADKLIRIEKANADASQTMLRLASWPISQNTVFTGNLYINLIKLSFTLWRI